MAGPRIPLVAPTPDGNDEITKIEEMSSTEYTPVAHGGTGATTAEGARAALDLEPGTDVASLSGGTVPTAQLPAASAGGAGIVQLATDLGGSSTAPTVEGIKGLAVPATAGQGDKYLGLNASATAWEMKVGTTGGDGTVTATGAPSANDVCFVVTGGTEPDIDGVALAQGSLLVGSATAPAALAAPASSRFLPLINDPGATNKRTYAQPRPIEVDRHIVRMTANMHGAYYDVVGAQMYPICLGRMSHYGTGAAANGYVLHSLWGDSNVAGIQFPLYKQAYYNWDPFLVFSILTPSDWTNLRLWAGMFSTRPYTKTTTFTSSDHYAGFRYDVGIDTNFMAVTTQGTSYTATNTGVSPSTFTRFDMAIRKNGASYEFYINDWDTPTVITTNLPTGTQSFGVGILLYNTTSGSTRTIGIQRMTLTHK